MCRFRFRCKCRFRFRFRFRFGFRFRCTFGFTSRSSFTFRFTVWKQLHTVLFKKVRVRAADDIWCDPQIMDDPQKDAFLKEVKDDEAGQTMLRYARKALV